jgi:predicted AlkP superfamily pyrophosphatase or phosphodiesterase
LSAKRRAVSLRRVLPPWALLLLAVVACPPARPAAPPRAPSHARRAVLLSFDGVSGTRLERLLAQPSKLPAGGFARLAAHGFFAVRSVPVSPSLTSAAHAAHVTGALPRDTGIVGNELLDPGKPFGARLSSFDAPLRAETLCEAGARQGRRSGVMAYPHAGGTPPGGCAPFGTNWVSDPLARPRLVRITASDWTASATAAAPSFSPVQSTTLDFPPTPHRVRIVALDSTNDGKRNYDRLRVEPEVGAGSTVGVGGWFAFPVRGRSGLAGAWCKLIALAPDLSEAEIYLGGIWETDAYPEDFRTALDQRAGFWPGRADHALFGVRSLHPEIYQEQSDRLTDFLTRTHLVAVERPDWDLLFLYYSEVDAVEHEFLLVDPRQAGYTAERAARFAAFIDHAYAAADAAVDRIERALTSRDAIFVTSDHGMTPIWNEIYVDEILRQEGYLRMARDGTFDPGSAAVAMASSGIAHVYINPAAPPGTAAKVEQVFKDFRIDGESPWDRVVSRTDAGDLGLDAPESGDLIVLAKPGTHLSMRVTPGLRSGEPKEYGGHGYRAAYRDLDATFLAAGPGVSSGRQEEIHSTQIAARLADALGIEPPRLARR